MKKKLSFVIVSLILVISILCAVSGCTEYGNLSIDYKYEPDNSIPRLTGDKTFEAMSLNPDRGFSMELFITLDKSSASMRTASAFPVVCDHPRHTDNGKSLTAEQYYTAEKNRLAEANPRVAELTVFLTNFIGEDISDTAFEQLASYLRTMRNDNMTVVLKFAYQHNDTAVTPSKADVIKHVNNVNNWISNTYATSLVKDSVSAIRLSFMGKDGDIDGYSNYSEADFKEIINACSALAVSGVLSQAPNVTVKNGSIQYDKLIDMGFFNNNLESQPNSYTSGGTNKKSNDYKQYVYQSMINYNSASLKSSITSADGKAVLSQLKDGYFTTFNVSTGFIDDNAQADIIKKWQNTVITKKDLDSMNLPYYDEWFMNSDGTSQNRSVYEYMRDFLGYNLSLSNLKIDKKIEKGSDGKEKTITYVSFVLTNYGMAAPLTLDKFELIIRNNHTGKHIHTLTFSSYDPRELVSGGQIMFTQRIEGDIDIYEGAPSGEENKGYSLGIRLYNNKSSKDSYVRLNNDITYKNNINWFYNFR